MFVWKETSFDPQELSWRYLVPGWATEKLYEMEFKSLILKMEETQIIEDISNHHYHMSSYPSLLQIPQLISRAKTQP